jgi:hypothetical protein
METQPLTPRLPDLLQLLDETIEALVRLDSDALVAIEQQASQLSSTPIALSAEMTRMLLRKKSLLAHLLDDTASNLTLLRRLQKTKDELPWAR